MLQKIIEFLAGFGPLGKDEAFYVEKPTPILPYHPDNIWG